MKAKMYNHTKWIKSTDEMYLRNLFASILIDSGFGIEDEMHKSFKPFGYTGLWLLSESHFAIHTFPEENKTYIELSSCIKKPYDRFIRLVSNLK